MPKAKPSKPLSRQTETVPQNSQNGGRFTRSPSFLPAVAEFAIVAGLSLVFIFIVIPAGTSPGGEIGLPPDLLPKAAAAAIGVLALAQFVFSCVRPAPDAEARPPVGHVLPLIGATVAGVLAVKFVGWEAGGALLALLAMLAMRERTPLRLVVVPLAVAAVLFAVGEIGL